MLAQDMENHADLARALFAANERVRSFKTLVIIRQVKERSAKPVARNIRSRLENMLTNSSLPL